jgi:uncharacterized repeat protein (TIGR02543 family)
MKNIKQIFFLSAIGLLIVFNNCSSDENEPTVNDDKTDDITYSLTITFSDGGTVTPESGLYIENESVELLATPDSSYVFVNWTGSITSTDNPLSVKMDGDKNLKANFVKKQYPLAIIIEGEGAVSEEIVTSGRIEDYDEGTVVKLTATPIEGWKFERWKELEVDTNPLEVTITEAITLTAEFTKNYALTLSALEGGTVSPESGLYIENDTVELIATPDSTYVFVNWTGSLTSTDNPLSIIMDADKDFTANFTKKQYPLTIIIDGEGAVSEEIVTNGRVEDYDVGTIVQLKATPSAGWKFDIWKELGVDTNPLEVTITEAITLTARFYVPIDSVSLTPSSLQMVVGDTDTLMASIYPTNVSDTIHWKSSDETIASVTQEGMVTAIAKGEAVITVMTAKDSITNTAKVIVSTDGDKDGVIDDKDTCADTPEGATVDTNGCSDSQKDTDGDGIKDDLDTCADTAEGATVDADGCAFCPSEMYVGEVNYVADYSIGWDGVTTGVSGTTSIVDNGDGSFDFADWSFGGYDAFYGCCLPSGTFGFTDVCGEVTFVTEAVDSYDGQWEFHYNLDASKTVLNVWGSNYTYNNGQESAWAVVTFPTAQTWNCANCEELYDFPN